MTATIPSYIDEKRGIVIFGQIAAMKFRVAIGAHIRNMHIANAPLRDFVDQRAIVFYPVVIAGGRLIRQSLDGNYACFFRLRIFNGELHFISSLVDQQFLRAAPWADALAIDRQDSISFRNIQARAGKRRCFAAIGGIALDDVGNTVTLALRVILPVYAQESLAVLRAVPVIASLLIGMGCIQLSLQFPEEIR